MKTHSSKKTCGLAVATLTLAALVGFLGAPAWAAEPEPAPAEMASSPGLVLTAALTSDGTDVVFTAVNNTSSTFTKCDVLVDRDQKAGWWGDLYSFTGRAEFAPGDSVSWRGEVIVPNELWVQLVCEEAVQDEWGPVPVYSRSIGTTNPKGYARSSMTQPLYRFYKADGTHFYTASDYEASLVRGYPQYKEEPSIGLIAPADATSTRGLIPIYRFYKPSQGTHFYTASEYEAQLVRTYPEYSFEGIVGYAASPAEYNYQGLPGVRVTSPPVLAGEVYRAYKWNQGTHFYTESSYEASRLGGEYSYEGVAFFVSYVYG